MNVLEGKVGRRWQGGRIRELGECSQSHRKNSKPKRTDVGENGSQENEKGNTREI